MSEPIVQYAEALVRLEALRIKMAEDLRDLEARMDESHPGWRDTPLPWERS